MEPPDSLRDLAAAQDGVVTRRQALEHGMSRDAIRHALGRSGRWQRVAKGVYATSSVQHSRSRPSAAPGTCPAPATCAVSRAPRPSGPRSTPAWVSTTSAPCVPPLVVEVDSVEWHRFGDTPEATERRRARYAKLGWRVLPVSPRRLREEPAAVRAEIEAAVAEGIARAA